MSPFLKLTQALTGTQTRTIYRHKGAIRGYHQCLIQRHDLGPDDPNRETWGTTLVYGLSPDENVLEPVEFIHDELNPPDISQALNAHLLQMMQQVQSADEPSAEEGSDEPTGEEPIGETPEKVTV